MDPAVLPAFLLAVALVELTPGPNMGYLAVLAASEGRRAGLFAVAGVTLGLAIYMLAAAFGLTEILLIYPPLFQVLRWAGVAFIAWMALEAWRGEAETSPGHALPSTMQGHFWRGFTANVLNPKAAVFYVLLLPRFMDPARASPMIQALTLGAIHLVVSLAIHTSIVVAGDGMGRAASSAGVLNDRRLVRSLFALSLAAVAVWLAISTAT